MAEIIRNVKNIHQSTTPPSRPPIFWNDKDRVDFIDTFGWALIPSPFHLTLRTGDATAGGSLSVKRGERIVTARLKGCP